MTALLDIDAIRRDNPLPNVAGGVVKLLRCGNEWKACCPFHSERTPSFTIFAGGERFHCFGCGASGDVLDFVGKLHNVGLREAATMLGADTMPRVDLPSLPSAPEKTEAIAEALAIWRAAIPAAGTLAETYLRSRAIHIEPPLSLRYAELRFGRGGRVHPCMIACISSPEGPLQGIQRTFLADDGQGKADVPAPRLSLGKITGGAIRLGPACADMMTTEACEDGLSLQQALGRTVWAAAGTANLPNIIFPPVVRSVAIGGDNDDAGRAAAAKAAQAYAERGLEARAFFPTRAKDFNAELMEAAQ